MDPEYTCVWGSGKEGMMTKRRGDGNVLIQSRMDLLEMASCRLRKMVRVDGKHSMFWIVDRKTWVGDHNVPLVVSES